MRLIGQRWKCGNTCSWLILIGRGLDQVVFKNCCCLVLRVRSHNPVVIARRSHPFPFRTRKLSSLASTILGGQLPGKIERCRNKHKRADKVNRLCPLCLYIWRKWVHTKLVTITKYRYSSIARGQHHPIPLWGTRSNFAHAHSLGMFSHGRYGRNQRFR